MEVKQNLDQKQLLLVQKLIKREVLTSEEEIELKLISEILNDYYPKIKIIVSHNHITINSNKPVNVYLTDESTINFTAGTNVSLHKESKEAIA